MWTLLTILFVIICGTSSETEVCGLQKSVKLVNRIYEGIAFEKNETILDHETKEERGCVCLKGKCARKCCPFGLAYKFDSRECIKINQAFAPPVLEEKYPEFRFKEGFNAIKEFIFMTGKIVCVRKNNEFRVPIWPAVQSFNLTTGGNLYVIIQNNDVHIYGPDKYCIDNFFSDKMEPHLNALICFVAKPDLHENQIIIRCACLLIFCFFTLLTVAVYAWLPDLRNLPGIVLMVYLLSFFVGYLIQATMLLLFVNIQITQKICTTLNFIVYFSLLTAFFWLNVMCYDIWWTFSGKRAHGSGSPYKRFTYYAIYAFGVPTVLTIILAALEFSDLPRQHPLLPKVRQQCFLAGNTKMLYLTGPIVILCVANLTFFGLTAFKIWKINKEIKLLRCKESSTHDQVRTDTQRFSLYVKLFTVMGINWLIQSSVLVFSYFYPDADFLWHFSNVYDMLIGPIIFIIFVCNKKTWTMIKSVCF